LKRFCLSQIGFDWTWLSLVCSMAETCTFFIGVIWFSFSLCPELVVFWVVFYPTVVALSFSILGYWTWTLILSFKSIAFSPWWSDLKLWNYILGWAGLPVLAAWTGLKYFYEELEKFGLLAPTVVAFILVRPAVEKWDWRTVQFKETESWGLILVVLALTKSCISVFN
jgi:hypothetical protein